MNYLLDHKTSYYYDKSVIKIEDEIDDLFKHFLQELKIDHIFDDKNIVYNEVANHLNNGYGQLNKDSYIIYIKVDNIIKSREKALEILSYFKMHLESYGLYLQEFSSYDDNNFVLTSFINDKMSIFFKVTCYENLLEVNINNLYELFFDKLSLSLNPYKFAYIIHDEKRSEMNKIDKFYTLLLGYKLYEKDLKKAIEIAKKEGLTYILTSSISLNERNSIRVLDVENDSIQEIKIENLEMFIHKIILKQNKKNYKESMISTLNYINNENNQVFLCDKCILENKEFLKFFIQNKQCNCLKCQSKMSKKYLIIEK